jgi:hypothetical protein
MREATKGLPRKTGQSFRPAHEAVPQREISGRALAGLLCTGSLAARS